MWKKFRKDLFSIPNILSYIRLLMVPLFIWVFLSVQNHYLTALILALSALTDIADGFIARKFNMVTDFGKIIDPIADKTTQFSILVCLVLKYEPVFIMALVLFTKEIYMLILGLFVIKKTDIVIGAKWYGKLNTCIIFAIIMTLLLSTHLSDRTVYILSFIGSTCMILSMIFYSIKYHRMLKTNK